MAREKLERRSMLNRHEAKSSKVRPTPRIVCTGREVSEKMLLSGVFDVAPEHRANLTIAGTHRHITHPPSERIQSIASPAAVAQISREPWCRVPTELHGSKRCMNVKKVNDNRIEVVKRQIHLCCTNDGKRHRV
uniref:Uncharacterized protein n=1 Tax=Trichogramma kaykai TaxID=54128 RepID=A0ABD2X111_9HYME